MHRLSSQITLALVALLLGVLVVVQLRAQSGGSSLDSKSIQDLTAIVAQLNAGNEQLREQLAVEQDTLRQVQQDLQQGQSAASVVQSDLNRLRGWAGLDRIYGPGVRLTLNGEVPAAAVMDAVNELWNAGADGVAIGAVRVVPGVAVSGQPGQLSVGSVALGGSVAITAVGDTDSLAGALQRPGGFLSGLTANLPAVHVTLDPLSSVTLPATDRTLIPRDAQARL